jgi:1-deoxy-D-xylulose-5-phosphate synthase
VIGDGALTGGLAYEALSHAGQLGLPLIIVLNDNRMSIGPNVGSLSRYLSRISMKSHYQFIRRTIDNWVKRVPRIGETLFSGIMRLKRAVKAVFYTDNFFVDLGFEYVGPVDGHNLRHLVQVFEDVRALNRPVVVHVLTRKGKGDDRAENDPGAFHGVEGTSVTPPAPGTAPANTAPDTPGGLFSGTFTEAFAKAAVEAARRDRRVVAITAAMEKGTGLSTFKKEFPDRFFDTAIAEEHAVTFAAGLAAAGLKPVAAIYSTFMQRAVDQVIHDTAAQQLPVVFAVDRAGLVAGDGETHQGVFDIGLFRTVPGLTILCPATGGELKAMLDWALEKDSPVMLRYPKARSLEDTAAQTLPIAEGRGVYLDESGDGVHSLAAENRLCLAFTGGLYAETSEAKRLLARRGIGASLYNLRFLKPVDEAFLVEQIKRFDVFAVIEEGLSRGGFGEYVLALAYRENLSTRIVTAGVPALFLPQGSRAELLDLCGLSAEKIAELASAALC